MLTLYVANPEALQSYTDRLSALFALDHAFQEISRRGRNGIHGDRGR